MPYKTGYKPRGRRLRFVGARRFRRSVVYTKPSIRAINAVTQLGTGNGYGNRMLTNKLSAFPNGRMLDMVYTDTLTLSSLTVTASTGAASVYQLGAQFDVDLTNLGTNHQPRDFDQISSLWRFYQVMEVGWEVTFFNPSTATCWVGGNVTNAGDSNYSIINKTFQDVSERPGGWAQPISNSGNKQRVWRDHRKLWAIEGMPYRNFIADPNYKSLINTNPAYSPTMSIAIGDFTAPVSVSTVYVVLRMVAKVLYYGTITPGTS